MPHRLKNINLLPDYEKERAGLFYLFIFLIVITLLAYMTIGFYYFSTKGKLEKAETTYAKLEEKAELLRAQVDEIQADDNRLEQAVSFVENNNILTSTLIEELHDLLPNYSYLSNYTYNREEVNLVTHFETLDMTAEYTTNLLTSKYIRDTKVDNISTFILKEEENLEVTPRYEANFTLQIAPHLLKGASGKDE